MQLDLNSKDLRDISDAVPHLDLQAILALKQAGFDVIRTRALQQIDSRTPIQLLLARGI